MAKQPKYVPPCHECGGRCCRYIAIGIDPPKNQTALHNIRWYLLHDNVSVFVDHEKDWFVEFTTPCTAQDKKSRCTVYEIRPKICRDYGKTEGDCEYYSNPYALRFERLEEFDTWIEQKKRKRNPAPAGSRQPK